MCNGAETFVGIRIETIAEKLFDVRPSELAWRQADSVHDDQVDIAVGRSGIEVRRVDTAGIVEPVTCRIKLQHTFAPCSIRMEGAVTNEISAAVSLRRTDPSRFRGQSIGPVPTATT